MKREKEHLTILNKEIAPILEEMKRSGRSPGKEKLTRIATEFLSVLEFLDEALAKNADLLESFRAAMKVRSSSEKSSRNQDKTEDGKKTAPEPFVGPPAPRRRRRCAEPTPQECRRVMRKIARSLRSKTNKDDTAKEKFMNPNEDDVDLSVFEDEALVEAFFKGMPEDFGRVSAKTEDDYGDAIEAAAELGTERGPCSELTATSGPILGSGASSTRTEERILQVPEEAIPADARSGLRRDFDTVHRMDLDLRVTEFVTHVESVANPMTGLRVRADTESLGPKGFEVTWRALLTCLTLVVGYAFPLRRLERLTAGAFSASRVSKSLAKIAEHALPVYLHMLRALANAPVVSADSAVTRVSEWTRVLESGLVPSDLLDGPLSSAINSVCPFLSTRKGSEGYKTRLHTTLLTGRALPRDPASLIVLYRTHVGDVGNLLNAILRGRTRKKTTRRSGARFHWKSCRRRTRRLHPLAPLVVQGDLSPANRVTNPEVLARLRVRYAGCLAHLRRPFVRYRHQAPEFCDSVLGLLNGVFSFERRLAEVGRNRKNTRAIRLGFEGAALWSALQEAKSGQSQWSTARPLGRAIEYFQKHWVELTAYLRDPRLEASNNRQEQLLRYEKLMDASSFGRDTVEGRARYDVLRSLYATCDAAQVDARRYFLFLLLANKDDVSATPQNFTPHAYSKLLLSLDDETNADPVRTTLAKKSLEYLKI